jgi:aquaporin Z
MQLARRAAAEAIGTFWLVLGGCGAAVVSAGIPDLGIGILGVSLAFGFTLLTMAYALGHISGCHLNPAVTVGLWIGGRFPARDIPLYVTGQLAGATFAAVVLLLILTGTPGFELAHVGLAENGYGVASPGGFSLRAGFIAELVLTCGFLFIVLGATDERAPTGFAPIAIGLALTLIHLVSIPITNTSVNPARSTGPALVVGGYAITQLWLFWVAPLLGGAAGGLLYRLLFAESGTRAAGELHRKKTSPGPAIEGSTMSPIR